MSFVLQEYPGDSLLILELTFIILFGCLPWLLRIMDNQQHVAYAPLILPKIWKIYVAYTITVLTLA